MNSPPLQNEEINRLNAELLALLACRGKSEAVIACIGTDLVGGDCLGPIVGQMLTEAQLPAFVYGTLFSPITALNADAYNAFIRHKHPHSVVIAVDSCVGSDRGRIYVNEGALSPAAALNKKLDGFGDISVTAVTCPCVDKGKGLMDVRLGFVYSLAKKIVSVIKSSLYYYITLKEA